MSKIYDDQDIRIKKSYDPDFGTIYQLSWIRCLSDKDIHFTRKELLHRLTVMIKAVGGKKYKLEE